MRVLFALLFALLLPASALAATRVVATVPDLGAVTKEVGGDDVEVTLITLPTQDPHFVDAKPSLALALSKADLLLVVGLDLEIGWLPNLLTGSRNPKVQKGAAGYVDCSQYVRILEVPGAVDRTMGDVHPSGNPHYLHDPRTMIAIARGLAEKLAAIDAANAAEYRQRAEAFVVKIEAARVGWEAKLTHLKGAPVVVYHRSWPYLQDWLGFQIVAEIEPRPGIPPTPNQVATVLGIAKSRGVKLILQETYYPDTSSKLIAERAGARVVRISGGADVASGQTWIAHMDEVVASLAGP